MRRTKGIIVMLILLQAGFVIADERQVANNIRQRISQQDLQGAADLYDQALKDYPKSDVIRRNGYMMYSVMGRLNKMDKAFAYLDNYIDYMFESKTSASIATYARIYLTGMDRQKKTEIANKKLESWIARAKKDKNNSALAGLYGQKAIRLAQAGKANEANDLIAAEHDKAAARLKADPDNANVALALIDILSTRVSVQSAMKKSTDAALNDYVAVATEQVKKHGGNVRVVGAFVSAKTSQISRVMRSDPEKAEKHIGEIEELLEGLDDNRPQITAFKQSLARTLANYKRRIASSKALMALEGKPGQPIGDADWVNGEALTDESLKGKVVLIDFWAVWCGPCIATFPHLREWEEKYSDKGLVILGATRYYQRYGFENGKLQRAATPLTASDEQKMLIDFAKYHKLKHRFVVIGKDNPFHKNYGVTGIPQAVVLDRKGIVRRIRVGSGEANAHDLEEMIKKCLAEKATE